MINFTLELVCLLVGFRYILGYQFQKRKGMLILGATLILIRYTVQLALDGDITYFVDYLLTAIAVAVPIFFFEGRTVSKLSFSAFFFSSFSLIKSLSWGIGLLIVRGDMWIIDFQLLNVIAQTVILFVLILTCFIMKQTRTPKPDYLNSNYVLVLWVFIFLLMALQIYSGYSGAIEEHMAQMIQGFNLVRNGMIGVLIIVIGILLLTLQNKNKKLKQSLMLNEKCVLEQSKQYRFMGEKDRELRKFRHDYNKHIMVIQDLLENGETEKLVRYISRLSKDNIKRHFISTNNIIGDAVINNYYEICKKEDIKLSVVGRFLDDIEIPEVDLCVIFSNAIDNAFEATQMCDRDREIKVNIRNSEAMLFIEIRNPVATQPVIQEGAIASTKEEKQNHGYGIQNMKEAANRNGGDVIWEIGKGYVLTEILIPSCKNL